MDKSRNTDYHFLPQVFLRAPYYSFAGYDFSRMPEVLKDITFRNAVWLASPEFYRILEKKEFDFAQLNNKEKHTLYKYYNRMCFRPTPFGSFASFSLLEWGGGGQIRLAGNDKTRLHLLPDQQLLHSVATNTDTQLTDVKYLLNPTIYRMEKVFRYIRSAVNDKGRYSFTLEGIAAVKFNIGLFAFLNKKKLPADELIKWVIRHGSCSEEEAVDYINFLLDAQAIYNEVQGRVITDFPANCHKNLNGWDNFWTKYGSFSLDSKVCLASLASALKKVVAGQIQSAEQPFYAALERPLAYGGPDAAVQAELAGAVQALQSLSLYGQPESLTTFIKDFRARFDRQKVPLLMALDTDAGLPYGELEAITPEPGALEDIRFPVQENEKARLEWNDVQQLLFRRWSADTLRMTWSPIQIVENDLKGLLTDKNVGAYPQTQALMYRDTGEYLVIEQAGGVTAASLIGRFSSFSDSVYGFCKELAANEANANPDVVFADIGQLSDTHTDNINRRKPIYSYEIPINVYSALPEEMQISPGDLLLSVQGDELILESIRLGKRVVPRLSTAYNFRHNQLPLFRLLCDLQFQGIKTGLSFDPETFFPGLPFYPRVTFGRVVLSPAKWIFKTTDIDVLTEKEATGALNRIHDFRQKHQLPRYITLGEHDRQLVFDLAQAGEAFFFMECLAGLKSVRVQEYFMPDRSVLCGKKPLAGQMVAFLAQDATIYKGISREEIAAHEINEWNNTRNFMIGSDWLYLKLFCNPRASDTLVAKVIAPFVAENRRLIKNWFFIRYNENGYHLRLRVQAEESHLGTLLVALRKKMESGRYSSLVRDYQGDTYRREMERYGIGLIRHVEDIFSAGSDLTARILRERQAGKPVFTEFELALLTAKLMISCFITEDELVLRYLEEVTEGFMKEFRADKQLRTGMDMRYRELKMMVADLLEVVEAPVYFKRLLKKMLHLSELTAEYSQAGKSALLADLVHMQLNRTFAVQQRQQEMLVYYCLQKYILSRIARNKQAGYSV